MNGEGWAVMGSTGEYEDDVRWVFSVYATEAEARVVSNALNLQLEKDGISQVQWDDWNDTIVEEKSKKFLKVDPHFRCDYTGVLYYLRPIRFNVDLSDWLA